MDAHANYSCSILNLIIVKIELPTGIQRLDFHFINIYKSG